MERSDRDEASEGGKQPVPLRDSSGTAREPTSVVLNNLLGTAHPECVTLRWLIARLGPRSFGAVLLLLALLSMIPGVSIPATLLLMVAAFQMMLAHAGPVFTRRLAAYQFSTQRIAALIRRVSPALEYLERFIRPRWTTPFEGTKRAVGIVVLLLGLSMFAPVPLSNIPPAILVVSISFAYLEEDGVLLYASLVAALIVLAAFAAMIWQMATMAGWLRGLP